MRTFERKIKIGNRYVRAYCIKLLKNNLIVFVGRKGYVMCGYLDLDSSDKFQEIAVKIRGVSTIAQALKTVVYSQSLAAKKMGIVKGQPIKDVLKLIA